MQHLDLLQAGVDDVRLGPRLHRFEEGPSRLAVGHRLDVMRRAPVLIAKIRIDIDLLGKVVITARRPDRYLNGGGTLDVVLAGARARTNLLQLLIDALRRVFDYVTPTGVFGDQQGFGGTRFVDIVFVMAIVVVVGSALQDQGSQSHRH